MSTKIREKVNNIILEQLENGEAPRRKSRNSVQISGTTGKPYSWRNQLITQILKMEHEYWTNRRLTFNGIKNLWGSVKKWEKAAPLIYYNFTEKENDEWEIVKIPFLRMYFVFNLDQTTLSPSTTQEHELITAWSAEQIIENFTNKPEKFQHPQPHYSPKADKVWMPHKNDFDSEAEYYATLFHEYAHSLIHPKRLDRKAFHENIDFKSYNYWFEELCAELTSAFVMAEANLWDETIKNSSAYIQWRINAIKEDTSIVLKSSAEWRKRRNYITTWSEDWAWQEE